ncbi:MAG: hypothetical protein HRT61_20600, partial [Ekhidna sp.]|nr:hypothetical protein [Ekhidna sp.]
GASVDNTDTPNITVIMMALKKGCVMNVGQLGKKVPVSKDDTDKNVKNAVTKDMAKNVRMKYTFDVVCLLLERGANVGGTDDRGMTVIMQALSQRCGIDVICLLLARGVSVDGRDNTGKHDEAKC